jgi:hypothetical protein
MTRNEGRRFRLVIIALPGTNAIRELRLILKRILRVHRFRCTSCEEITDNSPTDGERNG